MKRKITIILLTLLIVASQLSSVFALTIPYTALYVGSNKAFVNDIEMEIDPDNEDVAVFVEYDRSYVPVRFISENYNGIVSWDNDTQTVTVVMGEKTIKLTIGVAEIIIDGEKKVIDTAPIIKNERTFLPLRACVEAIGKEVFYDRGLILISDVKDILDKDFDADIVDLLISYFYL